MTDANVTFILRCLKRQSLEDPNKYFTVFEDASPFYLSQPCVQSVENFQNIAENFFSGFKQKAQCGIYLITLFAPQTGTRFEVSYELIRHRRTEEDENGTLQS